MSSFNPLALEFTKKYPIGSAKILEGMPYLSVSKFLQAIELESARQIIRRFTPTFAALVLSDYQSNQIKDIVSYLPINTIVNIIPYLAKEKSNELIGCLDTKKQEMIQAHLNYDKYYVGAWMFSDVVTIADDLTVKDAIKYLKSLKTVLASNLPIFVIRRDATLVGMLESIALVMANDNEFVSKLIKPIEYAVKPNTTISAAKKNPGFKYSSFLPVVSKENLLLGVLRSSDLKKALENNIVKEPIKEQKMMMQEVIALYGRTLALATISDKSSLKEQ